MRRVIVLDNEAVQALMSVGHPRHRRALAHIEAFSRSRRKEIPVEMVVPTAVRVEAGWDRRAPRAATINRFRIRDAELDKSAADSAASLIGEYGVSVADAHLGAVIAARHDSAAITVVTSDPEDIRAVAGSVSVTIVRL